MQLFLVLGMVFAIGAFPLALQSSVPVMVDPADTTKLTTHSRDRVFVSHAPAPAGATGGELGDIVLWIPAATLSSRMIAAGALS